MSENQEQADAFDPFGMMKDMRDANMKAWSKMMTDLVNTDAYSGASAEMLNSCLDSSTPFRKMVESTMKQAMANVNVASADDFKSLAERFTNIEMRLDDMDAKLDQILQNK